MLFKPLFTFLRKQFKIPSKTPLNAAGSLRGSGHSLSQKGKEMESPKEIPNKWRGSESSGAEKAKPTQCKQPLGWAALPQSPTPHTFGDASQQLCASLGVTAPQCLLLGDEFVLPTGDQVLAAAVLHPQAPLSSELNSRETKGVTASALSHPNGNGKQNRVGFGRSPWGKLRLLLQPKPRAGKQEEKSDKGEPL